MRFVALLSRGPKPLMRNAGLPRTTFQTLRRSNATFLVMLGVSPRVAMAWMGHSDVATTMGFRQQAPDELQEKASRLIGSCWASPFRRGKMGSKTVDSPTGAS